VKRNGEIQKKKEINLTSVTEKLPVKSTKSGWRTRRAFRSSSRFQKPWMSPTTAIRTREEDAIGEEEDLYLFFVI